MIWSYILVALSAACAGYLASSLRDRHACVICHRPLPRVCADARCGDAR